MTVSGLTLGFVKGWSLTLVMCGIGPIFMFGTYVFSSALNKRVGVIMRAYSQSAGYAQQALEAVHVVVAFGMEKAESRNYNKFLDRVTKLGFKADLITGASLGFFVFLI